ncbi:MAG: hypothetical protein JNL93_18875 [Pelomonas sp.]|nr:hypothetical protein [Roseateles sp.]
MRHFLLLLLSAVLAYGLWQLGGRRRLHHWVRHALRLAAVAAVLLAALVVAYHSPALKLL